MISHDPQVRRDGIDAAATCSGDRLAELVASFQEESAWFRQTWVGAAAVSIVAIVITAVALLAGRSLIEVPRIGDSTTVLLDEVEILGLAAPQVAIGQTAIGSASVLMGLAALALFRRHVERRARAKDRLQEGLEAAILERADTDCVRSLALAAMVPELRAAADEKMVELFPTVDMTQACDLPQEDVELLCGLLAESANSPRPWPVVVSVVFVLSQTESKYAIPYLEDVADRWYAPADVRTAAEGAALAIRNRIKHTLLLRASKGEEMPAASPRLTT